MSKRPASPPSGDPAADDLAIGLPAGDVSVQAGGGPPDWIKIAPRGELKCRDGRSYTLDPETIVARNKAEGVKVPVDVGHGTTKDATAPAIGWAEELQARPDGLYGRIDWLPGGRQVLAARTHRYVSPAFHHDAAGRATYLHSIALVAAPALAGMGAVASALPPAGPGLPLAGLAAALGLPATADEPACLAALSAGFVTLAVHQQAVAMLSAANEAFARFRDEVRADKVQAFIEGALKDVKIIPAQRDGFVAMCATDAGFEAARAILAATPARTAIGGPSPLAERRTPEDYKPATAATLAARANAIMAEKAVRFDEAMVLAMAEPRT